MEVVHELGLCVGVCRAVCVKDEDAIVLDQDSQVEEVDKDCGGADEDVGKEGGIYFSEIPREEAILFIQSAIVLCHVVLLRENGP